MSYYVANDLVFFGQSEEADRWIETNINGAERASAVPLAPVPPTEVHPGVLRYERKQS